MGDSPAAILFDTNGLEVALADGTAISGAKQGLLVAGRDPTNNARFIRVLADGTVQVAPALVPTIVMADYHCALATSTSYFLGIDLDNDGGAGPYKHSSGTAVKMVGVSTQAQKYAALDDWDVLFGSILTINGAQATIGWLRFGSIRLQDTGILRATSVDKDFPVPIDMTVSGGDYTRIASGFKEIVTAVNTSTPLPDVSGVTRTPAVGDVVIRSRRNSGSGGLLFHFCFWYLVE